MFALRPFLTLSIAASLILVSPRAFGQEDGAKTAVLQSLLSRGVTTATKTGNNKAATRFKPAGTRLILDSFVNSLVEGAEERKGLREALNGMMEEYEKAAKSSGLDNDLTLAVGYAVSQYWSLWKGTEVSDKATDALYQQMRGILETPEVAKLSDADKQRLYEKTLYMVFIIQVLQAAGSKDKVAVAAQGGLQGLVGIEADKLRLTEKGLTAAPGTVAATKPTVRAGATGSGTVPAHTSPPGYEKKVYDDGSIIYSAIVQDGDRKHDCEIRLLAPRPAPNGAAKAFQQLWKETFKDVQAGEVSTGFRRVFYPAKAVCHYMGGFYKLKNNPQQNVYVVLYVFDLGKTVQPVVASVLPGRSPQFEYDPQPSAFDTLGKALGPFIDSLRMPNVPPVPASLFTRAEAVGYWTESASSMVVGGYYVTPSGDYAGEMMSAYGGYYHYNPDGTFYYRFAYANRGARDVGQDKNEGTFTVKNDILVHKPKSPRAYKYDKKIVGCGFQQTDKGIIRTLILRGANSKGEFTDPPWMPNGRNWEGSVFWLSETTKDKK
jgi:hypothetical protein